ncbi:MAG: hypothetical protein ACYC0F_05820 [Rhodanobacter sp.]
MVTAEIIAEFLAFLSGALLLRPALRANGLLREIAALHKILQESTAKVDRVTIPVILKGFDSSWDPWDDRCLKSGAVLFVLSGLVKLVLVCLKP